jgi:pimeloyl-ACP methyl ester carboxylesterase
MDLPIFTDVGTGPAIVLLHGMPGSRRDFKHLMPALRKVARVVALDLPGFGESPVTAAGLGIPERAEGVAQVLDHLDLRDVIVLGHSMGGPVAVALAQDPRVAALALVSSVGPTPHRPLRQAPGVLTIGRFVDLPGVAWLLLPLLRRAFRQVGFRNTPDGEILQTLRVLAAFDFTVHRANLHATTKPALVAWCVDDPVVEPALGERLAEILPDGPRHAFPTGGHNPQAKQVPALVDALVALRDTLATG